MMQTMESMRWPRTLFGRLSLILLGALLTAHALSFTLSQWDKMQVRKNHMVYSVGKDVGNAISFLDRLPVVERPAWLDKLARNNYQYVLQAAPNDAAETTDLEIAQDAIKAIQDNLEHPAKIRNSIRLEDDKKILQLHLALHDGTPLTVRLSATPYAVQWSMVLLLGLQLIILTTASWLAVRVATRPLAMLANAADAIVKPGATPALPLCAPQEVYLACTAFQNMQQRIDTYLTERMHILAAIAHDLQTPITRMRLRTEFIDDDSQRNKMQADLQAMQKLVEQGLAYAQVQNHLQTQQEALCKVALDSLLASLVQDYCDTNQAVALTGNTGLQIQTQPQALNRLLSNLIDNALKFGCEVRVMLAQTDTQAEGQYALITVQDQGPGIPRDQWQAVMQPFVRLDTARNSDTGGAGLGLAIVQQLAGQLQAKVEFSYPASGGFAVSVLLPLQSMATD